MGIRRDSRHKKRATGGVRAIHQKKKKYEMGRPSAATKLGASRIRLVRCRGGNIKHRALRLDHGNFSWASEAISRKTRILGVAYNASSNEFVRTNTLTKNTIVTIDATPFKMYYNSYYGTNIGQKKKRDTDNENNTKEVTPTNDVSQSVIKKRQLRLQNKTLSPMIEDQLASGRILACISSRPGQSGTADGYILEGNEYLFYKKKLEKKQKK